MCSLELFERQPTWREKDRLTVKVYRVTIVVIVVIVMVIVVTNQLPNATCWLATLGEGAEHVREHSLAPV